MKNYPSVIKEEGVSYFTLCEQCGKVNPSMTIVYDALWRKIRKDTECDFLCMNCMEKSLGRRITLDDLKYYDRECTVMIPANFKLCKKLNENEKRPLRYLTFKEFCRHFRSMFNKTDRNLRLYKLYSELRDQYIDDYLK